MNCLGKIPLDMSTIQGLTPITSRASGNFVRPDACHLYAHIRGCAIDTVPPEVGSRKTQSSSCNETCDAN